MKMFVLHINIDISIISNKGFRNERRNESFHQSSRLAVQNAKLHKQSVMPHCVPQTPFIIDAATKTSSPCQHLCQAPFKVSLYAAIRQWKVDVRLVGGEEGVSVGGFHDGY